MGFNKRILPRKKDLVELRKSFPDPSEFISSVIGKSDALIGSNKSFSYIKKVRKEIKNNQHG
jgi:hypothetical protein